MASVFLVRRWGSHDAGQTVEVDDTMAAWLTGNNIGERPDAPGTASAGALAPGTDGADLRAGGDVTRAGGMKVMKGSRNDGDVRDNGEANYANRAARVPGAPKPVGDVSHVAEENLGKENKEADGDVLLASGKTLGEDLKERQAELDKQDQEARKSEAPKSDQGDSKDSAAKSAPPASGKSAPAKK
jgi:hypothetical protein